MKWHSITLFIVLGGLHLAACGPDEPSAEEEIPVASGLVNVLVDLRLIEARAEVTQMTANEYDSLRTAALKRHNETEASLARRIEAAGTDPQMLERLLEEVQTALSLERQGEAWGIEEE